MPSLHIPSTNLNDYPPEPSISEKRAQLMNAGYLNLGPVPKELFMAELQQKDGIIREIPSSQFAFENGKWQPSKKAKIYSLGIGGSGMYELWIRDISSPLLEQFKNKIRVHQALGH